MEHIALTANILWQIWKARNDRMFNNVQQYPLKIIQKAQNEWMEYKEAKDQEKRMSMLETPRADELQGQRKEDADTIHLNIAVQHRMGGWDIGIGIVAEDVNKQILAQWALKEATDGNKLRNQAVAVKLALCKAREKEWKQIQIKVKLERLLKMIQTSNSKDMAMHSHLEDIRNLCSMFTECSFILSTNLTEERVDLVIMHALSISFDEEWLHS